MRTGWRAARWRTARCRAALAAAAAVLAGLTAAGGPAAAEPATAVRNAEPATAVRNAEPATTVRNAKPATTVRNAKPATAVRYPAWASATGYDGLAFDACAAPQLAAMRAWRRSPYQAIGVYVGGQNRTCAQPALTRRWVAAVSVLGWRLIPIFKGRQPPCGGGPPT